MVARNMLMSLVTLEESQSDEERALREIEIIRLIRVSGTSILCIITVFQVIISLVFYWRARKVK